MKALRFLAPLVIFTVLETGITPLLEDFHG